ncbi:MAG: AmmeMemoRadiSam system protein A [Spirochaetales bacterium]|nr:AmmeMemoRadiSam system protein A [Spirochaetales bacterium]
MDFTITHKEKLILIKTARLVIENHLFHKKQDLPETTETLKQDCGAFVTLHKKGSLRGCIGYVMAVKSLINTIKDVAVSAAFRDPRFPPLSADEYSEIDLEISVISPFEPVSSIEDIQVGKHGLMIRKAGYSGLLLPQVATEYGWDRETFLTHTCYKAGLSGDEWKSKDTSIEMFTAIVFGELEMGLLG